MRSSVTAIALAIAILFSGCIQPKAGSEDFTEHKVTESWKPDGAVGAGEYSRSLILHDEGGSGRTFEVRWKNDGQNLYMALIGQTKGWVAIGFEPSVWMKDADMIIGYVNGRNVIVQDQYSTGNYGPHQPDTELGGTDDIQEYGGMQSENYTVMEFKRKMNTGDKFDKAFVGGQSVSIIWSLSDSRSLEEKHTADGKGSLALE